MILVLSGTSEAKELVAKLVEKDYGLVVTTATAQGKKVLREKVGDRAEIMAGRLSEKMLDDLIDQKKIKTIIDATHPFAEEISRLAKNVAEKKDKRLIRLTRAKVKIPADYDNVSKVDGFAEAIDSLKKYSRILITTGSNNLEQLARLNNEKREVIVRVLPVINSIKKCRELGFSVRQIIACQGPFSQSFNEAVIKEYSIEAILTKASGQRGGLKEKLTAAYSQNIDIIIINRPEESESFAKTFYNIEFLLKFMNNNPD